MMLWCCCWGLHVSGADAFLFGAGGADAVPDVADAGRAAREEGEAVELVEASAEHVDQGQEVREEDGQGAE